LYVFFGAAMTRTRSIFETLAIFSGLLALVLIGNTFGQSGTGFVYLPMVLGEGSAVPIIPTDTPTLTPTNSPPTDVPTETPTIAPTMSATPTATRTPTVTPTPISSGSVSIVSSSTYESSSYLHLVGEVRNTTADPREFVKVSARFYGSSGQVLATDFTYTYMSTVVSGAKACFDIILSTPHGWTSYQFDAVQSSVISQGPPSLIAQNITSQLDAQKNYSISGEVHNSENTTITYVQPIATLYNTKGTVVDCDFTYVNSQDLSPGGSSGFTLTTYGRDESDVASYALSVDGNRP
jgi:hypothetical protein